MTASELTVPFTDWRAFHLALPGRASPDAPNLDLSRVRQLPDRLVVDGIQRDGKQLGNGDLSFITLHQDSVDLDLGHLTVPKGWRFRCNLVWLFTEIEVEADRELRLCFGANWHAAWWCNGQRVADTFTQAGNGHVPPTPLDHDVILPLRSGRNLIAVEVLSGGDGFTLHVAEAPDDLEATRAARAEAAAAKAEARRLAIRGPARVEVDANQILGPFTRPERRPSISLNMAEPETLAAWVKHIGRPEMVRVFGAVHAGFLQHGVDWQPPEGSRSDHDAVAHEHGG